MGKLLHNRASQPGLRGRRCTLDPAAATVVAAKAKGEEEELRAILQHTAVPQPETPFVDAEVPSVCEGMIPTESRMREIRTSGSTSGGWNLVYGRRSKHRRESVRRTPRTLRAPRQPSTLPLRSGEGWLRPPSIPRGPRFGGVRGRGARPAAAVVRERTCQVARIAGQPQPDRPLVHDRVCGRRLVGKPGFRTESEAAWSGTVVCPAS